MVRKKPKVNRAVQGIIYIEKIGPKTGNKQIKGEEM